MRITLDHAPIENESDGAIRTDNTKLMAKRLSACTEKTSRLSLYANAVVGMQETQEAALTGGGFSETENAQQAG
jgi:hypothetical protein